MSDDNDSWQLPAGVAFLCAIIISTILWWLTR